MMRYKSENIKHGKNRQDQRQKVENISETSNQRTYQCQHYRRHQQN